MWATGEVRVDIGGSGHAGQVLENNLSSAFSKGNGADSRLLGGEGMPLDTSGKAFGRSVQDGLVGVGAPGVVVLRMSGAEGRMERTRASGQWEEVTEENRGEPGRVWGLAAW